MVKRKGKHTHTDTHTKSLLFVKSQSCFECSGLRMASLPPHMKALNCACHILVLLHFYPEKCVNKHFFVAGKPLPDVFIPNVLICSCVPLSHNELKRELAMCPVQRILLQEPLQDGFETALSKVQRNRQEPSIPALGPALVPEMCTP